MIKELNKVIKNLEEASKQKHKYNYLAYEYLKTNVDFNIKKLKEIRDCKIKQCKSILGIIDETGNE